MREANGILEDLGAVIGTTAANRLVTIFGPGDLYIPNRAIQDHAIGLTIGAVAFGRLVSEWPGQTIKLCSHADFHHARMVRCTAAMIKDGIPIKDIADVLGLKERQVRNLRAEAEHMKLLPEILRGTRRG